MKNKKVIIGTLLFVAAGLILAFLLVGSNGDDLQGRLRVRQATPSLLIEETLDDEFKIINGGSEFESTAITIKEYEDRADAINNSFTGTAKEKKDKVTNLRSDCAREHSTDDCINVE